MPELPDIVVYIEALERRIRGKKLQRIRLANPFLLRSVEPPLTEIQGRAVSSLRRLGKRIVFVFEPDLFLVLHLMIAGRLHWKPAGAKPPAKIGLAAFDFDEWLADLDRSGQQTPSVLAPGARRSRGGQARSRRRGGATSQ